MFTNLATQFGGPLFINNFNISSSLYLYKPYLVGDIPTPLKKYEFVSWDYDYSQLNGKS